MNPTRYGIFIIIFFFSFPMCATINVEEKQQQDAQNIN